MTGTRSRYENLDPAVWLLLQTEIQTLQNAGNSLRVRMNLLAKEIGQVAALAEQNKIDNKVEFGKEIDRLNTEIKFLRANYNPYYEFAFNYSYGIYGYYESAFDYLGADLDRIKSKYRIYGKTRVDNMDLFGPNHARVNAGGD